jgi:hypothetical protein
LCNGIVTIVERDEEIGPAAVVAEPGAFEAKEELDGLEGGDLAGGGHQPTGGPDGVVGRGGDFGGDQGRQEPAKNARRDPAGAASGGHGRPLRGEWTFYHLYNLYHLCSPGQDRLSFFRASDRNRKSHACDSKTRGGFLQHGAVESRLGSVFPHRYRYPGF